jgi:hypothetical protein
LADHARQRERSSIAASARMMSVNQAAFALPFPFDMVFDAARIALTMLW